MLNRSMLASRQDSFYALTASILLATVQLAPARAEQKVGMPDLAQEEETCLPTSTANLIVWFGKHGYPKLIVPGDSDDDGYIHTVHAIMADTNARYDLGTRTDWVTRGIRKYITNAGYGCDVEYRGIDWSMVRSPRIVKDYQSGETDGSITKPQAFTPDWLGENGDPQKGFILLLAYCRVDRATNTFVNALHAGHAVTLVDAQPDTLLIHDPAHWDGGPGRKIITPETLTDGTFQLPGYNVPVNGLMLLSGSLLEAPPESVVMLTGAVCITMHPDDDAGSAVATLAGAPAGTIGAAPTSPSPATAPAAPRPAAPASNHESWAMWLFDWFFGK